MVDSAPDPMTPERLADIESYFEALMPDYGGDLFAELIAEVKRCRRRLSAIDAGNAVMATFSVNASGQMLGGLYVLHEVDGCNDKHVIDTDSYELSAEAIGSAIVQHMIDSHGAERD